MMQLFSIRGRNSLSRRLVSGLCMGALAAQIGCYSYLPVQTQPPVKADRLSLTISERGRTLLAERIGPLLDRVEGRFVSSDSTNVTLAVTRVINIKGDASNWLGENVVIPREAIQGYQDRPYSKRRTFFLVGALVGALAVVIASITLAVAGGSGHPDPTPGDPSGQQ